MNTLKIIRAVIPEADEELASYIVWERTPYPFGKVTAKTLYKTASRLKRAADHNIELCDYCDNMLQLSDKGTCKKCTKSLTRQM